jgi:hypothetical protein
MGALANSPSFAAASKLREGFATCMQVIQGSCRIVDLLAAPQCQIKHGSSSIRAVNSDASMEGTTLQHDDFIICIIQS